MNVPLLPSKKPVKLNCAGMLELSGSGEDGLLIPWAVQAVLVGSLIESLLERARRMTSSNSRSSSSSSVAVGPSLAWPSCLPPMSLQTL
jgi:hypothetical protein